MPARQVIPNAERWLEWGMASSQPGSRVRDAENRAVFTGSLVALAARPAITGKVIELVSEAEVVVRWSGSGRPSGSLRPGTELPEDPRTLIVLG